jgi:GTP cyclohydrolase FolE2
MELDRLAPVALPRYRRTGPGIQDLFGVSADHVLGSMERAGDDVPGQHPAHELRIEGVALRRRDILVRIQDPFESLDEVTAVCTLQIAAGVPAERRGIHASRIGHAIAKASIAFHRDPSAFAAAVARAVAEAQYGQASVTVHARVPYLEEVGERSGRSKSSLERLHLIARHTIDGLRESRDVGLRIAHLIACPCVQQTFSHATQPRDSRERAAAAPHLLMTHSQRCATTIMVHDVTATARVRHMLAALDTVLVRTCNTLPRDAELATVYRAHRTPQFIEDAVRAAAIAMARAWTPQESFEAISVRARSLESIHEYDLTASLRVSAARLMAMLATLDRASR